MVAHLRSWHPRNINRLFRRVNLFILFCNNSDFLYNIFSSIAASLSHLSHAGFRYKLTPPPRPHRDNPTFSRERRRILQIYMSYTDRCICEEGRCYHVGDKGHVSMVHLKVFFCKMLAISPMKRKE